MDDDKTSRGRYKVRLGGEDAQQSDEVEADRIQEVHRETGIEAKRA